VPLAIHQLAVWTFTAFWLWLGCMRLLERTALRWPAAVVVAAILGWVGAGLLLEWMLPGSWFGSGWGARPLFSMR
jgi:hypothetical protein